MQIDYAGMAICSLAGRHGEENSWKISDMAVSALVWVVGLLIFWYVYLSTASADEEGDDDKDKALRNIETKSRWWLGTPEEAKEERMVLMTAKMVVAVTVVTGFSVVVKLLQKHLGQYEGFKILVIENEIEQGIVTSSCCSRWTARRSFSRIPLPHIRKVDSDLPSYV